MRAFGFVNRLLFGIALAMLLVVCLLPQADMPLVGLGDKVQHVIAYAVLMVLGRNGFAESATRSAIPLALFALGCAIEALQDVVPGRAADLADVIANTAGLLLGWAIQVGGRRLLVAFGGNKLS